MARPPTSMMTMAMTQAKTGRSRKNFESISGLRSIRFCSRLDCLHGFRSSLPAGFKWDHLYGGAGAHFLNSLDDQAISRFQPLTDQPCVADGPIDRDLPLLDLIRAIHDQRDGIPLRVAGDRLLRNQDGLIDQAFLYG